MVLRKPTHSTFVLGSALNILFDVLPVTSLQINSFLPGTFAFYLPPPPPPPPAQHIYCAPDRKPTPLTDKIQTTFAQPKIVRTHDPKAFLVLPI